MEHARIHTSFLSLSLSISLYLPLSPFYVLEDDCSAAPAAANALLRWVNMNHTTHTKKMVRDVADVQQQQQQQHNISPATSTTTS